MEINDLAQDVNQLSLRVDRWLHEPTTTIERHFEYFESEIKELKEAIDEGDLNNVPDRERIMDEYGDVLYNVLRVGTLLGMDSEQALIGTLKKLGDRAQAIVGSETNEEGWRRYREYKGTERK